MMSDEQVIAVVGVIVMIPGQSGYWRLAAIGDDRVMFEPLIFETLIGYANFDAASAPTDLQSSTPRRDS